MTEMTYDISDTTKTLIDQLVEYSIDAEYGKIDQATRDSHGKITAASVLFDMRDAHARSGGSPEHTPNDASYWLRPILRAALAARECQHIEMRRAEVARTGQTEAVCHAHTEHDVPDVDGYKLCGRHYTAEADARNLP